MAKDSSAAVVLQKQFAKERHKLAAGVRVKLDRFFALARAEGISLDLSKSMDTLFVRVSSQPPEAYLQPLVDNLYLELNPATDEIVGMEIQDFGGTLAAAGVANAAFGMLYSALVHYGSLVLPAGARPLRPWHGISTGHWPSPATPT